MIRTHKKFKAPINSVNTRFHGTFSQGPGWKAKVAVHAVS